MNINNPAPKINKRSRSQNRNRHAARPGGRERQVSRIKQSKGDFAFSIIVGSILTILSLSSLIPIFSIALTSITPMYDIRTNPNAYIIIPQSLTLNNYIWLFKGSTKLIDAYKITIFRTLAGTLICLLMTIITAYPLSKKYLPGRKAIMMIFLFTMFFSGGMIPTYMLIRYLGLANTFWVMILPCALSVYYMIIMRTFFSGIPEELEESARIDGATDFTILYRIILPLALPTLASIGLFYAVFHWNAFMDAVLYLGGNEGRKIWPLQMLLRQIITNNNTGELQLGGLIEEATRPNNTVIVSCCLVISALPIICVYPFLQRYFVRGLMVGSLKG